MPDEALQGRILEALQRKSGKSEVKEQMKQIQQGQSRYIHRYSKVSHTAHTHF